MSSGGSNPWNKQNWIKDVLSKSGTDIVEVKDEKAKEVRKMVYYPPLPLIMKSESKEQQLLCSPLGSDPQSFQTTISLHPSQQTHHSAQLQHQQLSNNVMLTNQSSSSLSPLSSSPTSAGATATLLISPSQSFLHNIKIELPHQDRHHQFQQHSQQIQQQQQQQPQHLSNVGGRMEQSHNSKVLYKCEQCNMTFGSKSAHTSHIKSHIKNESNYQQTVGSASMSPQPTNIGSGGQMKINGQNSGAQTTMPNQGTSTGSDPYQCNVCKKTFAVPARLIRHYRTHTGERPFECEFCHKMFSVKENLQVHRRIHTKERPYKCDVCGRAFEHSGKLHRHMRIHTGERPHKCSVCSKTFIQSGQLVIHMRTHTGEKPYKCPVEGCGKGFTCSKQLKVHSRTHTGEKPYHCDICFRDFGYNHVLKLHRVQHYGSKCYKCTICDETFKSKKEMEAHIKRHANEMPDDDDEQQQQKSAGQLSPNHNQEPISNSNGNSEASPNPPQKRSSPSRPKQQQQQQQKPRFSRRESLPDSERSHDSSATSTAGSILMETPIDTSSEANSETEDTTSGNSLYNNSNMYQRLEQSGISFSLNPTRSTINPALLAAASIASRRDDVETNGGSISPLGGGVRAIPPTQQMMDEMNVNDDIDFYHHKPLDTLNIGVNQPVPVSMTYEPLAVMKQNGYFAPAPVPEFRPSLRAANDIVRRVEAAIAGAEPLLTPPRSSSTESPERSSSPESDSMILADRDVMTLPLRKRKLYLNDNQSQDVSPVMRMSSVIQFAKAS